MTDTETDPRTGGRPSPLLAGVGGPRSGYDVERVRKDFPILARRVHDDRPLVYLDSAASSQKPTRVLDAERDYYELHNANVHRGIHTLAEEATALYENARDKLAAFIGAPRRDEIVFAKNSSEALNLVAYAMSNAATSGPEAERFRLGPGDEVAITEMEHHSNLVPWQMLCRRTGATLRWIGITDDGRLDLSNLDQVINERTKLVSFVHQSNILGTVNPVATLVARAREVGALVVLDGSQSVPHMPVDVVALDVDFLAFTGHKMCGPTGIGVLWGRGELLAAMPPFLGGGEMIELVTMESSTYADPPHRFEAGTPMIAQAVGLGAAVDYLTDLGMDAIAAHEHDVTAYALEQLTAVPGLRIIGPTDAVDRGGAVSFVLTGSDGRALHPHDVGQLLDELGIAVRVGQHCARPVCLRFGVPATTRASFHLYSTRSEVGALVEGLGHVGRFFGT
ncbi:MULTISPECIES: cysteine desulfurase [Protofrankia]|uniref:Cysteine desulfurase n=2 Tax=Candidatus Protofrankia datiscae TaxID=2716812 RepID=F8B5J8_9ACTN|nr:cysteine desulfurase [Candidatus Protofrankia datiscae]AEH09168.1 cysteine desulfurase, SufS subfamily [Candidatus Protofrankia datiscae]